MNEEQIYAEFGLDDLAEQTGRNKQLLKIGFALVGFILWSMNAWTTGEFFRNYGQAIGAQFGADVAGLFAFFFGVIIIDVAYVAWLYFPVRVADASEQLLVGIGTAVLLFLMSLTATGVYISLTNELAQAWLNNAEVVRVLSIIGTVIFALSLAVNAIGLLLWMVLGAGWKRSRRMTDLRSLVLEKRGDIDRERAELVTRQTLRDIRAEMNAAADVLAAQNRQKYLEAARMANPLAIPANQAPGLPAGLSDEQILAYLAEHPDVAARFFGRNAGSENIG